MTRRAVVRASRFVTPSNQVDRGAELAARRFVDYWCAADHHTSTPFAADVEPPAEWPCSACDGPATTVRGTAPVRSRPTVFPRTPYEFLMMRRTVEDGERLLAEALTALRRRRRPGRTSSDSQLDFGTQSPPQPQE
jgi:hypothetical protein